MFVGWITTIKSEWFIIAIPIEFIHLISNMLWMEEILHHLGWFMWFKLYKSWDELVPLSQLQAITISI